MTRSIVAAALAAAAVFFGTSAAQAQASDAIQRLRFLAGTWHCSGAQPNGLQYTATRTYSFPTSGPWMQEVFTTQNVGGGAPVTGIEMWGSQTAYVFMPNGVETKRVVGWNGNNFLVRSENPKYTQALYGNAQSIEWTMGYPNGSSIVETCKR